MFTWEESDRAKLTQGCTVEHDGERREVRVVYWDDGYLDGEAQQYVLLEPEPRLTFMGGTLVDSIDPSTLQPPTLATLNRMAVESFGYGVVAYLREPDGLAVWRRVAYDDMRLGARFYEPDAARECARWLAARGR